MLFNKPLYYCSECKLIVADLDKLLFIEDHSNKGFCSETCIEDFYHPLIRHFELLEASLRARLHLQKEKIELGKNTTEKDMIENVLARPSEVWSVKNDLGEEIFTYIKHFENFSSVILCTVYKGQGSFVFLNTQTKSREFLAEFRRGVKSENPLPSMEPVEANGDHVQMNEEDFNFMQLLENKKSGLLADLLTDRLESDISFEEFNDYEICFQDTLDTPDEVFETRDKEGDSFFVYIKSFIKGNEDYFYIISCLKRPDKEDEKSISVFPVLAFPTNDVLLYAKWRTGKKISGHVQN